MNMIYKQPSIVFLFWVIASCGNQTTETTQMVTSNNVASEKVKELFLQKCATCHAVNTNLTGPALKDVETRWTDKQKLYAFIRHSQAVVAEDSYAKNLYNQWNKVEMTAFPDLTNEEIGAILAYVKQTSKP